MPINIVIVDDNKNRRESLHMLINDNIELNTVGIFENCESIDRKIEFLNADVVLMDIDMPKVNGIEGVMLIRNKFENIKIIMQTVFEDDEKIFSAIRAGANGYILKKSQPEKLIDAIFDVIEGGAPLTPQIAQRVITYFSQSAKPKDLKEEYYITDREKEILQLLAAGKSYKLIADVLGISTHTVNNHIKKIYKKLHVNSATEAIAKIK